MANNNNEGADNNLDSSKDAGLDKSFVGKFVTGLINNTPLSKWFGKDSTTKSVVRRRDDEDDEDDASYVFQPPVKRAKLPSNSEHNNYSAHVFESPVTVHNASNNINNVSTKVFGKFPEPVAGPSGIQSRKLFEKHSTSVSTNTVSNSFDNVDVNGDNDSDSEASTSGYSSAQKLSQEKSKQSFNTSNAETGGNPTPKCRSLFTSTTDPSPSRSLFAERSPQMNTSLSSRRPAFNASTFGSPSFVDKTLSTRRILDSPFYSGSTIYGGASAYGRRLGKHGETSNNSRVSVQIKPVNAKAANDSTTLSKTARRILTTLEQYSTPISDAKKIPVTPKRQGILSKYVGATPYLTRDRKRPSNRELQVPTVPELLQMKQKERLQNSTESVRQIATSSKSTLNKDEYKLRTEDDNKQKHCNKMKNNVISVRQKAQPVELVGEVKLPKVSLPITTLPKFDFVMMTSESSSEANTSPSSSKPLITTVGKAAAVVEVKKQEKIAENGKINHFTFSEPLIIAKDLKSISAINCFKFSEPLCKKQSVVADNFKTGDKNIFGGLKTKNNGESVIKPANQLVTGSVMDVLGKRDEFTITQSTSRDKPKQSCTWECDTCLVKNDMDKTMCVACDEPKPKGEQTEIKGFGDQFKLSSDKWECSSCMVRNNNSDKNCVACANAKPGDCKPAPSPQIGFGDKFKPPASSWECTSCLIRNKNELDKCAACGVAKSEKKTASWGDKFRPSNDTWECSSCMIRNKNELDKCQACETPKSGTKVASNATTFTFGDKFKAPPETWECPTCMIRNKNELVKCSACETVKPGHKLLLPSSTTSSTTTMFSFGIKPLEWECKTCLIKNKNESSKCAACGISKDAPQPEKKGFGEAFKAKEGEWECSSCLVRNKPGIDACACCGVARSGSCEKSSDVVGKEAEKKPVISFNFGISKSSPVQFKFGIPATKNEESKDEVVVVSSSSVAPAPTSTTTKVPAFVFGDVVAKTTATVTSSTFSFGMNTQEKTEPAKSITSTSETVTPTVVNNPLLKPTEKLPEKAAPAPVGFKFGLDSSNLSQKNDSQKPVSSENLVTSTSKTETPVFSSRFEPAKPTSTFQFKPAAINGDINKPKETLFASKPVESNPFANASIPATFKFNPQPAENTAPGATHTEAKAPIFKFGADSQVAVKKTFGETSDGAVSNGFASPPKIPAFGSPQGFGATPSKPFSFGASDSTPKNPTFSFGQSEKPSANPVFNFGGGASSTPSSGFNFSASTSASTGFNFGAAAKVESQAQPFSTPAPAPTSVFGAGATTAGKNGSFNFGTNANNNNQKAIFSFGASQTNQPSFGTPTQSGFNFGAPAPPTIPPGGFTFTGAQPSFNFTDGSTSGVPPQRKIKKALRRTHR